MVSGGMGFGGRWWKTPNKVKVIKLLPPKKGGAKVELEIIMVVYCLKMGN